jgi:hypothetical protein
LVSDIKKSELSFNNIPFNPSTKKPLFSKNKSLSSISSKQTVRENRENILAINQFNKGHSYPASFNGKYIKLGEEALLISHWFLWLLI